MLAACTNCQPSCEAGSSFGRKQEWSPHSFLCGTLAMNSNFVYHAKNPVCARATNDPRIIRPRLLDGRKMAKQQLRLEELSEEGRQWAKNPELKPKPKEPRGMEFAMARLDKLILKSEKEKQAQQSCLSNFFLCCLLQSQGQALWSKGHQILNPNRVSAQHNVDTCYRSTIILYKFSENLDDILSPL